MRNYYEQQLACIMCIVIVLAMCMLDAVSEEPFREDGNTKTQSPLQLILQSKPSLLFLCFLLLLGVDHLCAWAKFLS